MPVDATAPADLIALARTANSQGQPAHAERLLRRAIRALARAADAPSELELHGAALIALASPVFERRGLDPALELLADADALLPGPDGDRVRELSRVQRAGFLARGGDWRVAVELLDPIRPDSPWLTRRQLVSVHLNRASALQYLGDLPRSLADLQTALDLAVDGGAPDLEFKARHNLGWARFLSGDVPQALRAMAAADAMAVDVVRATAKRDYAHVLLQSGLLDEAAALLLEARAIATEHRLHHEVGEILLDQARLELLRGRAAQAEASARAASRLFQRRGAQGWWVQAAILRGEATLARGTTPRAAARLATTLVELPTGSGVVRRDALLVATEAGIVAGDLDGAAQLLADVSPPGRGAPAARLRYDWVATRLALAQDDRRGARRRMRAAADRLARQLDRPASLDARTAFALHARRLVATDVGAAVATGSAAQVLGASERWRAATARLPSLVPHPDEVLDDLFARLRATRVQLRDLPDPRAVDELARQADLLEDAIRRREWELADNERSVHARRPVTAAEARAHAAATDSDVLVLLSADDRLRAVTIDATGIGLHDVGAADAVAELTRQLLADVAMAGRRLPAGLATVVRRSLDRHLATLAEMLPIPRTRPRLVITTTRVLRSVPWRLVPGVDDRAVVVTPSLTAWTQEATAIDLGAPGPSVVALSGPGLARADAEAAAVATAWEGAATSLERATGADLTSALVDSDLVHVAAHGHHHDQNPLFSSVVMSDGPLFAYELQRHGVRAPHVVLSACDIGRAMMRPGDEAVGLTACLLACGARSVVAATAPVSDDAAAQLMTGYHAALAAGLPSSRALQTATEATDDPWQARLFTTYGTDWTAPAVVTPPPGAPSAPPVGSTRR